MKRAALTIVVFAAIGAVINVGVAWKQVWDVGAAVRRGWIEVERNANNWPARVPPGWPRADISRYEPIEDNSGEDRARKHLEAWFHDDWDDRVTSSVTVGRYGFPWNSLKCVYWSKHSLAPMGADASWVPSIDEVESDGLAVSSNLHLPLRPEISGFLANTAIYAIAAWLITRAPFTARRALRRRRGLCMRCGYNVHDIDGPCPECGTER